MFKFLKIYINNYYVFYVVIKDSFSKYNGINDFKRWRPKISKVFLYSQIELSVAQKRSNIEMYKSILFRIGYRLGNFIHMHF